MLTDARRPSCPTRRCGRIDLVLGRVGTQPADGALQSWIWAGQVASPLSRYPTLAPTYAAGHERDQPEDAACLVAAAPASA